MTIKEAMIYQLKQLKGKPLKQKIEHIITYFWVPIVVTLVLLIATVSYIVHLSNMKDVGLSVICLNARPNSEATEQFLEDFSKYASIDTNTYRLLLDDGVIMSADEPSASYEASQVIMIRATTQQLDVLVGNLDAVKSYIFQDFFGDLREQLTPQQQEKYAPYFLYTDMAVVRAIHSSPDTAIALPDPTQPELMEEPIPVALLIPKESELAKQYYPGKTAPLCIGILDNTKNLTRALAFLDFSME